MAEPTSNFVPRTADASMFDASKSIENAVKQTLTPTTSYKNFDDLRNNCVVNLIDENYGTQGTTPTTSGEFRGYPRPTVYMNYQVITHSNGQTLYGTPTLNNKVGYALTVRLDVEEDKPANENPVNNYIDFTISSGATTASAAYSDALAGTPPSTAFGYRINNTYIMPSLTEEIRVTTFVDNYTVDVYDGSQPYNVFLQYTATPTVITYYIQTSTLGDNCGGWIGVEGFFVYSTATLANGNTMYSDFALTTTYNGGGGWFITNQIGDFTYDRFTLSSVGVVGSYTNCS